VVDEHVQVFRQDRETRNAPGIHKALAGSPLRRMLTYEDVAFPENFHKPSHLGPWCEMFAVRTPQRPVKVMSATSKLAAKKVILPAIWKSASTSLTSMLYQALANGSASSVLGPHDELRNDCQQPYELAQCEKHTTFDYNATANEIHAAFVRSPLDRFVASIYEHGNFWTCYNKDEWVPCGSTLLDAKKMARRLAQEFPHEYRSCEHPTQAYFLSATDVRGEPYAWDLVQRLEEFDEGITKLESLSGINLTTVTENTSGNQRVKQKYFEAIFNDLEILCSVCKVFAQDFECLGYAKPQQCTPESCSKVGVSLAHES